MMQKTIQKFNHEVSILTRIAVLIGIILLCLGLWFRAVDENFIFTSVSILVLVLIADFNQSYFPSYWHTIKWLIILGTLTLTLIGFAT